MNNQIPNLINDFNNYVKDGKGFLRTCTFRKNKCDHLNPKRYTYRKCPDFDENIVKLNDHGHQFTQQQYDNLIQCLIHRNEKSYMLTHQMRPKYYQVMDIVFKKCPILPSVIQLTKITKCFENYKKKFRKNPYYISFRLFQNLLDRGYVFDQKTTQVLNDLGFIFVTTNDLTNINVDQIKEYLLKNIRYSLSLIEQVVANIKKNDLLNDTYCLQNILTKCNFNYGCSVNRYYNDSQIIGCMCDENAPNICNNCSYILRWFKVVENLMLIGGCDLSVATCNEFIIKMMKQVGRYERARFNNFIFNRLLDFAIKRGQDMSKVVDQSTFDLFVNNSMYNMALYVADNFIGLTKDHILQACYYTHGIISTKCRDWIKKYCILQNKMDASTFYFSKLFLDIVNNKIQLDFVDAEYKIGLTEDKYLSHFDYERLDTTKYDVKNIYKYPISRDTYIDPHSYRNTLVAIDNKTVDTTKYQIGRLHMMDLIVLNGIAPDVSLMRLAIHNNDLVSYQRLKEMGIVPDNVCLHIALRNLAEPFIQDIIRYKIMPDLEGFKQLCSNRRNWWRSESETNKIQKMISLLISNGLKIDKKMLKLAIKNDIAILDISRFNIKIDESVYYYMHKSNAFNKEYIANFSPKLKKLHEIREKYKKMSLKTFIEYLHSDTDEPYMDGYCVLNSLQNKDLFVFNHIVKELKPPPMLMYLYNKDFAKFCPSGSGLNREKYQEGYDIIYNAIEKEIYGNTQNIIEKLCQKIEIK